MADEGRSSTSQSSPIAVWAFLSVAVLIAVASSAAVLLPFDETVPFGCGRNPPIVDGLIGRLIAQAVLILALASGLLLRFALRTARRLSWALVIAATLLTMLAFTYYSGWAALETERGGAPPCGGAWAEPASRGLIWALPAIAMTLDAAITILLRLRWPKAGSIMFSVIALCVTALQLIGAS